MPKSPLLALTLVLPAVLNVAGCVGVRHEVRSCVPAGQPERGVVFVADGAGGFAATTAALTDAIRAEGLPLRIEEVEWSHGWGRVLSDQIDYCHVRDEGRKLAEKIVALRRACPAGEVYLVGHSAGAAVVLAALEAVPPNFVDRAVLLAPAVSAEYDLRAALRGVRCGLDVFSSRRDWFCLGLGMGLFGTTDRCWSAASGRVGFRPEGGRPTNAGLYARLRQHPWGPCQAWTGNQGGHYGSHRTAFLRAYVLPLFQPRPCICVGKKTT
jgi:pimeloyl-ACP methyl ester carboxylesterase